MMPSSITSLPPELLDTIIQHLSSDQSTLRSCALVSRTWSVFSQRALFRNAHVHLYPYAKSDRFLNDLTSIPHLQTLVRGLTIQKCEDYNAIPSPAHLSCVASVLSLLPNLTRLAYKSGINEDYWETRPYLNLILGNTRLVELDIEINAVETFHDVFAILEGTSVKRVSLSGSIYRHEVDLRVPCKHLHLPLLECIRFRVSGLEEEFHNCLTHNFDLPNLKECEIVIDCAEDLLEWRDLLLKGFPPLESFKLELGFSFVYDLADTDIPEEDAFRPLPLAGLPFQYVHLSIWSRDLDQTSKFIEWWSSTFCALSNSKATIHFTQLTLAFTNSHLRDIDTLGEAWNSLDNSLAHSTFSSVRCIHFKGLDWWSELATQAAHPVLEDRMRLVLPQLASQGVLRFD